MGQLKIKENEINERKIIYFNTTDHRCVLIQYLFSNIKINLEGHSDQENVSNNKTKIVTLFHQVAASLRAELISKEALGAIRSFIVISRWCVALKG